jgi:hypothetical protein
LILGDRGYSSVCRRTTEDGHPKYGDEVVTCHPVVVLDEIDNLLNEVNRTLTFATVLKRCPGLGAVYEPRELLIGLEVPDIERTKPAESTIDVKQQSDDHVLKPPHEDVRRRSERRNRLRRVSNATIEVEGRGEKGWNAYLWSLKDDSK